MSDKHYRTEDEHVNVMRECLDYIKGKGYILKGGTALMLYYDLGRFSEDLDFDIRNMRGVTSTLKKFCDERGYSLAVKKETEDRYRAHIHYGQGNEILYLKFEASAHSYDLTKSTEVEGVLVYTLDQIADMKLETINSRYRIRDIYDIITIYYKYGLSDEQTEWLVTTIRDNWTVDYVLHHLDFESDKILPYDASMKLQERVLKFMEEFDLI